MLKILVVGAGAVGGFVGGRLAAAGHQVTLVGRPPLMEKVAAEGLSLRYPTRPEQVVFPKTATSPENFSTPFDFIFITVKSPDPPNVLIQLKAAARPLENAYLVSLQNGIGNEETLVEAFGRQRVIAGTITIPVSMPERGVIAVRKDNGGLGLASLEAGQPVPALADALNQAGLFTPIYQNYQAMKWSKLLLNIVNNASSAILDEPPAQVIARPALFDLEIEALKEGVSVMRAQDFTPVNLPGYRVNWLAWLVSTTWLPRWLKRAILRPFMLSGRGSKMPSLYIDLTAGRTTTEVNILNGAIARAGQTLGVATPVNQTLTDVLSRLVSGQSAWADYRHRPDMLLQAVAARRQSS